MSGSSSGSSSRVSLNFASSARTVFGNSAAYGRANSFSTQWLKLPMVSCSRLFISNDSGASSLWSSLSFCLGSSIGVGGSIGDVPTAQTMRRWACVWYSRIRSSACRSIVRCRSSFSTSSRPASLSCLIRSFRPAAFIVTSSHPAYRRAAASAGEMSPRRAARRALSLLLSPWTPGACSLGERRAALGVATSAAVAALFCAVDGADRSSGMACESSGSDVGEQGRETPSSLALAWSSSSSVGMRTAAGEPFCATAGEPPSEFRRYTPYLDDILRGRPSLCGARGISSMALAGWFDGETRALERQPRHTTTSRVLDFFNSSSHRLFDSPSPASKGAMRI